MTQDDLLPSVAPSTTPTPREAELIACWSDSGVYGDGSCPELQHFVHCRNCPVYSSAAARLLDQPLPEYYRREWTQHFALEKRAPEAGSTSLILFRVQSQWLALPTRGFQEVAEKRALHSLPNRSAGILLGLANVRGELVTCVSLGHLLRLQEMPSLAAIRTEYRRLLVVHGEAGKLAFPVDEVRGPNRFHPQELKSPPATLARANPGLAQAVLSWQDQSVGLLDAELLLSSLSRCLA
jgi:chemotaxis-related protein WspD